MDNTVNLQSTENLPSTVVNEVTSIGNAYRRLIDKAAKLWLRISYWTHASDVEFDDGKTAQEKVGNINGITSDFENGAADIAASSVLTKIIKDDLNAGKINDRIQFVLDDDGNLGWKKDGADAVIPFSSGCILTYGIGKANLSAPKKGMMVYATMAYHHNGGGYWAHIVPKGASFNYCNKSLPAGLTSLSETWGWTRRDSGGEYKTTYWWDDAWCVVWGSYNVKDYRTDYNVQGTI